MNVKPKPKGVLDKTFADERSKRTELKYRSNVRAKVVVDIVQRYLENHSHLQILDFGTAEGRTLFEINRLLPNNTFLGIEYSQDLIDSAPELPANITIMCGDVTERLAEISSNSFDLVTALAFLEHLSEPLKVVKQTSRILRPGGLFVATCPDPFWDRLSNRLGLLKDHHEIMMSKHKMITTIKSAGLELIEYRRFMWAPLSFLPYLNLPISASFSLAFDYVIESCKIFNWLFVNQRVIASKTR